MLVFVGVGLLGPLAGLIWVWDEGYLVQDVLRRPGLAAVAVGALALNTWILGGFLAARRVYRAYPVEGRPLHQLPLATWAAAACLPVALGAALTWLGSAALGMAYALLVVLAGAATFAAYALDKTVAIERSITGVESKARLPETLLHALELLGGYWAAFLSQRALRHKLSKESYRRGFRAVVAAHVVLALLVGALLDTRSQREHVRDLAERALSYTGGVFGNPGGDWITYASQREAIVAQVGRLDALDEPLFELLLAQLDVPGLRAAALAALERAEPRWRSRALERLLTGSWSLRGPRDAADEVLMLYPRGPRSVAGYVRDLAAALRALGFASLEELDAAAGLRWTRFPDFPDEQCAEIVRALEPLLADGERFVRYLAARELPGRCEWPETTRARVEALCSDASPLLRTTAFEALQRRPLQESALAPVLAGLGADDERERLAALRSLRFADEALVAHATRFVPVLVGRLEAQAGASVDERVLPADVLGATLRRFLPHAPVSAPRVAALLAADGVAEEVVLAAYEALFDVEPRPAALLREAVPQLARMEANAAYADAEPVVLYAPHGATVEPLLVTLASAGPAAADLLAEALTDTPAWTRKQALLGLGCLGTEAAHRRADVAALAEAPEQELRALVAAVLGRLEGEVSEDRIGPYEGQLTALRRTWARWVGERLAWPPAGRRR